MAIDPVAVSGAAAAKLPAGADVAAQSGSAGGHGANFQNAAAKAGERVDLLDYTNQQKSRNGLSLDALGADGKARYLANPSTLGEKVLGYMEKFHDRIDGEKSLWNDKSALQTSTALASNTSVPSGPASSIPGQAPSITSAQSANSSEGGGFIDQVEQFRQLAERSSLLRAETTLISGISQQFSTSMSSLLRGQ